MVKDSPQNTKINKSGKHKPDSKKENTSLNVSTDSDHEVSFNKPANSLNELQKMFEHKLKDLQKMFEHKLTLVKTEMQSKVDTLYNVVHLKEETIGTLQSDIGKMQAEIGQLEKSCNYLTKETSDNHNLISECNKSIESKFSDTAKDIKTSKTKQLTWRTDPDALIWCSSILRKLTMVKLRIVNN